MKANLNQLIGKVFVLILVCLPFKGFSQELALVRDTTNKYEVGVPIGWRYGVPTDNSVNFVAFRQKANDADLLIENYNINILKRNDSDLNRTFKEFKASLSEANNFKILEEGEMLINQVPYKWLIETHKNQVNGAEMKNYAVFANKGGKILILTMVSTTKSFEEYKPLFHKIALSLKY